MHSIAITYSVASVLLIIGFIYNLQNDLQKIVITFFATLSERLKLRTNERITARHNLLNKNSSHIFEANRSIKDKDILMCLYVVAREYGGEIVDKN